MRLLHYLEIRNFKNFGELQRIELDHPAVLFGPNNCGKTTAIQAIAFWSQAVRTWFATKGHSTPKKRTATSLNRLNILSAPVQRTRHFWHNMAVRHGNRDIAMQITVGILHDNDVHPVTMRFRNLGDDLVYCTPDDATLKNFGAIETAAKLNVKLLYPMSGLETDEPVLQPGRIDALLGQGQTAQVLRNLCLLVFRSAPEDWERIKELMNRLFSVELGDPAENLRGSIDLHYRQPDTKDPFDLSLAGRGLQQMLLIFAYLYSHSRSVLLIDEPDAHLEILRQKQVYVLLREIAARNQSQVVLVTHSEVILDEALDDNLTLLLEGKADDLAAKKEILTALKHFGTGHYVKARQRGYVLYVEGRTDLDILRALAERIDHPASRNWDERINAFYVQDNFPEADREAELERVEGGFGVTPDRHFSGLHHMLPELHGLAILDGDGKARQDREFGALKIVHWKRYEIENYFIAPDAIRRHAVGHYEDLQLFDSHAKEIQEILDSLILERAFDGRDSDFSTWKQAGGDAARLIWEARTENVKLSDFAEEFYRLLAGALGHPMLMRKSELHELVRFVDPGYISPEVTEKLDLLDALFQSSNPHG